MIRSGSMIYRFLPPLFASGVLLFAGVSTDEVFYGVGDGSATSTKSIVAPSSGPLHKEVAEIVVTHLPTPTPLRGAYMTSCIASGKKLRAPLTRLIETTELNALIIDIKDFSGMVSIDTGDSRFVVNKNGCTIPDIKEYIADLHAKGIYVIGRVTVMQDSTYTKAHPEDAVKKKSDGTTWKDKKGLAFVDPRAKNYWKYMVDLGKLSYALGFDEINYDYIRFPSDGDMANADLTLSGSTTKSSVMAEFYEYLGSHLRTANIPTSADLFGMTTTNTDDLGIGQIIEDALRSFDYVAPMVYPSHYPPYFNGWKDPNMHPYDIVYFSMSRAVERANALEEKLSGWTPPPVATSTATGTPPLPRVTYVPTGKYASKLRPWLQDFNYGKIYTEADVRAQIKATYDAGLDSFMMWDPKNVYTKSAYLTP